MQAAGFSEFVDGAVADSQHAGSGFRVDHLAVLNKKGQRVLAR